jgi:N-ethylmaleimide reductase
MNRSSTLLDSVQLGDIRARNRIFMAPMTRGRSTRDHVPTPMMAEYYAQRAGAGLILSEATGITREGLGWPFAPGLWNVEQLDGWRRVTAAVHEAGGRIVAQLWHMGRVVHPSYLDGAAPVSCSATIAPGTAHTYDGKQPYVEARALTIEEINRLLDDYSRAAYNAMEAGFDGVQLHAANGYLIDQFLRQSSNLRNDTYGGSVENRLRLLVEVTQRVAQTVGAGRTAVRLSPNAASQGVSDPDPHTLFLAAAKALHDLRIAFLELRQPSLETTYGTAQVAPFSDLIRGVFTGPLVLNSDYDAAGAERLISSGKADAISFGRAFIANPDLPLRIARGLPVKTSDMMSWYSQGPVGYVDYPAYAEEERNRPSSSRQVD